MFFKNIFTKEDLPTAISARVQRFRPLRNVDAIMIGTYQQGECAYQSVGSLAPDAESGFQIGSITKVITAYLLLQLCSEKKIHLDETLEALIGTAVPLSARAKSITLRQLATHTSGLPRLPPFFIDRLEQLTAEQGEAIMDNPYECATKAEMLAYLGTTEGCHEASRFVYSNYGMGLLGHVAELLTGQSYESLLTEKVFQPLGMHRSYIPDSQALKAGLLPGYCADGKAAPLWTFQSLAGAGAIVSNTADMLTFIQANLQEDAVLFQQMRQPQSPGKTGLGWMQPTWIDRLMGNKTIVFHNGMVGGYAAYLAIDAATKTGVVILANQEVDVTGLGMAVMREVRSRASPTTKP